MVFPETPRILYGKNPLDEVVCQLRFPDVLRISSSDPVDFQERIRLEYPYFVTAPPPIPTQGLPPEVAEQLLRMVGSKLPGKHYEFTTAERRPRTVSLTQNFVALTEHDYQEWSAFRSQLERVERALRESYQPAFYTRLGLLYKNVIDPVEIGLAGPPFWGDLIKEPFVGLVGSPQCKGAFESSFSESLIRLEDDLGSKVLLQQGLGMKTANNESRQVYIFSADFYVERKVEPDDVFPILDNYQKAAGNLFRWAVTDTLAELLGRCD